MFDKTKIQNKLRNQLRPYEAMLKDYLRSLRDIRNVGLLVFTVLVLLISWSGVKAIQTNFGLQKQIATLEQQNNVGRLRNQNQTLLNDYYTTPQYREVTARQNLGLAAPGEKELLIPRNVALAHTVAMPKANEQEQAASKVPKRAAWQRNFQSWMDFFLHRRPAD